MACQRPGLFFNIRSQTKCLSALMGRDRIMKKRESPRGWDWSLRGILATVQSGLPGQEISYFMDTIANHQERPGSPGGKQSGSEHIVNGLCVDMQGFVGRNVLLSVASRQRRHRQRAARRIYWSPAHTHVWCLLQPNLRLSGPSAHVRDAGMGSCSRLCACISRWRNLPVALCVCI